MDERAALFVRMAEILGAYTPFTFDAKERERLADAWHEIAPSVAAECAKIKAED